MAFAITQTCCADASCVAVCPVNCIHPTPEEAGFGTTDMLHVDPRTCIDCGACADACPVDAIFPVDALTAPLRVYADINAAYYAGRDPVMPDPSPNFHPWGPPDFSRAVPSDFPRLDVAVVGTGPAGMYAVADLLLHTNARVTLLERLPVAGGLVRFGVAPDHPSTRRIGEAFARFHHHSRLRLRLGVEAGRDVSTDELAARYDAVIYAVGAATPRRLGVPGEHLSVAATTVVGWYNGHPDVPATAVDLSAERVVVVGTGNVALDVARILTADPADLAGTAIAPHALAALRTSKVREVVLLGRGGPESAAYTRSELLALTQRAGAGLAVDTHDPRVAAAIDSDTGKAGLLRGADRVAVDWSAPPAALRRRIVLRFHSAPLAVTGDRTVRGLRVTGGDVEIATGQVVLAVGHRGTALPGLPFDETTGTIPHTAGRVTGHPGVYVVGWIKRGSTGGIGANRRCAAETVGALVEDVAAGRSRAGTARG
jgi:ferredoxin/flavodoxin---NADP+ reductase